ncbi:MAG: ThuA domain-containing protein [Candidatus Hinthialibacter antarcticus]|nr:ThuA domain-containing protein [Candidatus Hinthialibacter antarcticus]
MNWGKIVGTMICLCLLSQSVWAKSVFIVADEWPQMDVLEAFFEENGYTVDRAEQDKMPDSLAKYDGVVEFIHGAMEDETAAKLIDYANQGGRLIVIHHGISSKKKQTKGWYEFLGVDLDGREGIPKRYVWRHDIELIFVNLQPEHYITSHNVQYNHIIDYLPSDQPSPAQTLPAIVFKDSEVFLNHQFTDGREKTVLFGFTYIDPDNGKTYMQDRSGWFKRRGKGWAFYFQPGHSESDFQHKSYCQILLNCLTYKP